MPLGMPYRRMWLAAAISNLGDGVALTAMPLLATTLTRDPVLIAGVTVAGFLPWLLFSLLAGALVDRLDRRTLMGVVDLMRAGLVGLLGLAILFGTESIGLLYVIVFLLGCAETLFDNASQAIMPMLVASGDLEKANSRLYAAQIFMNQFAGPPLGGFLFAVAAVTPFLLDAGSFVAASALVLAIPGSFRVARSPTVERTAIGADIAEGLRCLWGDQIVRGLAIALGVFNLASNGVFAIFVLFALGPLGLSETGFGILLGVSAIGAFLGTLLAPRVSTLLGRGRTLVAVAIANGVSLIVIGIVADPVVTGALFALEGFAGIVWNVITVSLRQNLIPNHLLGRVNSVYRLIGWGTIPIGALAGGLIARGFGVRATFYVAGAVIIVMAQLLVRPLVPMIARAPTESDPKA